VRSSDDANTAAYDLPEPHIGPLGRMWIRGLHLDRSVAACTLPFAARETQSVATGASLMAAGLIVPMLLVAFANGPGALIAVSVVAAVLASFLTLVVLPRRRFRRLHRSPLTVAEIERVLRDATVELPGGSLFLSVASHLLQKVAQSPVRPPAATPPAWMTWTWPT
jgi:hypothetical protein